jgi:hypothetical protein
VFQSQRSRLICYLTSIPNQRPLVVKKGWDHLHIKGGHHRLPEQFSGLGVNHLKGNTFL